MKDQLDRLLGGRTRDIRLEGEMHHLFWKRVWPQTTKIVRSWMIWVAILTVLTVALNALMVSQMATLTVLVPAGLAPSAAAAFLLVWRKATPRRWQGISLLVGMFLILTSIALVGQSAGGEFHERSLNFMMFVATSAIIIFGIPLAWTVATAAAALSLYIAFQIQNPAIDNWSVAAGAVLYAGGLSATVVARRTITPLAKKAFLLELRDKQRVVELAQANDRLERLAKVDPLTGLANRRWMAEILEALWSGRDGIDAGAAMLMCDIDDFKSLNDHCGHAEGDRCLATVASIIADSVRRDFDHVARYGGEEFLVLLPGAEGPYAMAVAERVRLSVERAVLPNSGSHRG